MPREGRWKGEGRGARGFGGGAGTAVRVKCLTAIADFLQGAATIFGGSLHAGRERYRSNAVL